MTSSPLAPAKGQMEIDWTAPAAQPRKQKMLDDLRLKCPKHIPRIITAAKCPEYVGRLARQCGCVAHVKKTIRTLDAFQQKNKLCWPSVATLAERAACSVRTIQRGLRLANQWGYVTIEPQAGKSTSHYSINWPRIWNETEGALTHETESHFVTTQDT